MKRKAKKNLFEIYLTTEYVIKEDWLRLFLKISRINGIFKPWNLWICIENNYIRYFVETKRTLPPIIGELGSFLLKKTDETFKIKSKRGMPCMITKHYKTVIDLYDKNESRKSQKIKYVKIRFYPHKWDNYLSTTKLLLQSQNDKMIRRKVFFNACINEFVSIDFSIHSRFFYKKDESLYLETKKVLHILNSDNNKAMLRANVFPYLQDELYLKHNDYDFAKHSVVFGASGTGKSKLISSMIKNLSTDINSKINYKVVIIDPHSSIENDIGGIENCNVIDFKTENNSINLFTNGTDDILSSTESIMSIFKNIIGDRYNSRLERVLRYSIHLLLAIEKFNLVNLRKLLVEIEYRNTTIREAENNIPINIIEFFRVDFNELKTKSYQEAIAPIISFIDEMQLLPAFNNEKNLKNIKEEIKNNFVTILSLDQMTLGLNITKTISGFAMQSILQLVQAHSFTEHIILIIDEVAIIENPIINRFLSEARKYNLSLILAGQYFGQISDELQKAIFTNTVNYFIFRISRADAMILESNIKMEVAVKNQNILNRVRLLTEMEEEGTKESVKTIHRIKILTELEDRECVVRIAKAGKLYSAFKCKTMDFIANPRKRNINLGKENIPSDKNNFKKPFSIKTSNSLKDIMIEQSASRKKLNLENNS